MKKIRKILLIVSFFSTAAVATELTVYKSPFCGCCTAWAEQMKDAGFKIIIVEQNNNNEINKKLGVTPELVSCHTAVIEGYTIEGHVPVQDIKRLLRDKPSVAGLAVPGMPASSPGMDVPGNTDSYQVIAFNMDGKNQVYSQYHIN
ncbi:DUF411 domain-containing protein [Psychromonas sp. SP041]|uniref:DUF411 domain-containing protein n=1 Tax=Psychromonas sp. SP041 TaxID=1365007 RepID=UPI0010C7A0E8|nr:DUF411 domain-containing protein [Psychromonas sp. SP041]